MESTQCQICGKERMTYYQINGKWLCSRCAIADLKLQLQAAEEQNAQLQAEKEQLILQAQGHAAEARCQRATVYEIYQIITGATGEPGDWNGAVPVKEAVSKLRADLAQRDAEGAGLRAALEKIATGRVRFASQLAEEVLSKIKNRKEA